MITDRYSAAPLNVVIVCEPDMIPERNSVDIPELETGGNRHSLAHLFEMSSQQMLPYEIAGLSRKIPEQVEQESESLGPVEQLAYE